MNRNFKNLVLHTIGLFQKEEQKILMLLGQTKTEQVIQKNNINSLAEAEFRVFSQYGEDGIIQYLISKIDIPNKIFVEFGVENYLEANTRFLLMNNNWSGLVIDGSKSNIDFVKKDVISWRHDITAVASFITKDNINKLISDYTAIEDIGLLSVDIDGNDYWVLDAIDVIKPRIMVCEYNNVFGGKHAVTVPYAPDFTRQSAHFSDLYFGASLKAICLLAGRRGYDFVGVNSTGINAFFVRKDLSAPFRKFVPEEVYAPSKNRESRSKEGKLTFLTGEKRLVQIREMKVYDVESDQTVKIADLYHI